MKRIVLTPELLRQQSQELSALTREYESLFSGVSGVLNSLNGNWSANLANNFSSKVASAQASFSSITELLEQGAAAAQTSADTFQSVDSLLLQRFSGETSGKEEGAAVLLGAGSQADEQFEGSIGDWSKEIRDLYYGLPIGFRDAFEEATGLNLQDCLDFLNDVTNGQISWDTAGSLAKTFDTDWALTDTIVETANLFPFFGGDEDSNFAQLMEHLNYYLYVAPVEDMRKGDYAGVAKDIAIEFGLGLYTITYGSVEVLSELTANLVEEVTTHISGAGKLLGYIIPGSGGELVSDVFDGISSVGEVVSGWLSRLL